MKKKVNKIDSKKNKKKIINLMFFLIFISILNIASISALCNVDSDCNAEDNGYCNILGECHYCSEGEYYSLGYAGCVECVSDLECDAQDNGVCGILQDCFYCNGNTPFYYQDKCVECIENSDCTEQSGGICNILKKCEYSDIGLQLNKAKCYYENEIGWAKWSIDNINDFLNLSSTSDIYYPCNNDKVELTFIGSFMITANEDLSYAREHSWFLVSSLESNGNSEQEDTDDDTAYTDDGAADDTADTDDEPLVLVQTCNGCKLDNDCYPFNNRKGDKYCSMDKIWINQKNVEEFCENNFECQSNLCIDDECLESGFFKKIIDWFKRIF